MKETYISNCERIFVNKAANQNLRLDGRSLLEPRNVQISFGVNWGSCMVSLGRTKAAAQVSCDIQIPKSQRPNEGMLHINVELNPIAAQHFEGGRQNETTALINRQIEKCIKDSRCVDLESLCIVAEKKVWNVRVDVNIINHDGNLIDCASIAALTALMHFHRPDVTSTGDEIIIHPSIEKDPLLLTLYHHPVCLSFITFENGVTIFDPSYLEERVGAAILTLSVNAYREICSLYFDYLSYTSTISDVVSVISNFAANYAANLIKQIKDSVQADIQAKYKKETPQLNSFGHCITSQNITSMFSDRISIKLATWKPFNIDEAVINDDVEMEENAQIVNLGAGTAELLSQNPTVGEGGKNTWYTNYSSSDDSSEPEIQFVHERSKKQVLADIELSDSDEESVAVLSKDDLK